MRILGRMVGWLILLLRFAMAALMGRRQLLLENLAWPSVTNCWCSTAPPNAPA